MRDLAAVGSLHGFADVSRMSRGSRLFRDVSRLFCGCRMGCFASFAAVSRPFHGCFAGVRGLTTC
eukprot:4212979-Prymnesium_polylepis.1